MLAWLNGPQALYPVVQGSVCRCAIRRSENRRQDAEQFVIHMTLARSDAGMVVFEKAPHLAKSPQILDLGLGKLPHYDARTAVELMVEIDRGLRLFGSGSFPDLFAVHQQLQVVRPRLAGSGLKHAKENLGCLLVEWQRD